MVHMMRTLLLPAGTLAGVGTAVIVAEAKVNTPEEARGVVYVLRSDARVPVTWPWKI
jgi:hypothetical protein